MYVSERVCIVVQCVNCIHFPVVYLSGRYEWWMGADWVGGGVVIVVLIVVVTML